MGSYTKPYIESEIKVSNEKGKGMKPEKLKGLHKYYKRRFAKANI